MDISWIIMWVVIGLAFALLSWFAVTILKASAKERRNKLAANSAWAHKVNRATTDEAIATLDDIPYSDSKAVNDQIATAIVRYREAGQAVEAERIKQARQKREADEAAQRQAVAERINGLRQREGTLTYVELEEFIFDHEIGLLYINQEDETYMDGLMARLAKAFADELCEKAHRGDSESIETLIDLVFPDPEDWRAETSTFQAWTKEAYAFPDDWNELIARLVENPPLDVFVGYEDDPAPGTIRLRAATALLPDLTWEERLAHAKIALAYADRRDDDDQYVWRDEIGPILLAEVSKFVASIHHAQQLVFASAIPTE